MIGLLDPALFLPRSDAEVERDLALVVRACREHEIQVVPLGEYWRDLWRLFAQPFERQLGSTAKRALQELRKLAEGSKRQLPALDSAAGKAGRAWFEQMFGYGALGVSWEERMVAATLRAAMAGEKVVLFTRRIEGRNLCVHRVHNCRLDETTRWVLHVQPKGIGHKQILCVHHLRNMSEPWTTRFDWRLPASSDGGRYPFCPPDRWWKGSTQAHRTVRSKPAWVDKHGNGWARPGTPGTGYHWDVFIDLAGVRDLVGLSEINVVEFGAPAAEGNAGELHHVPDAKEGKVTGTGWSC
jgi:hypothetical protein